MSEPGTIYNWYPNMNLDISKGIGILYLKGCNKAEDWKGGYDMMFASTGSPSK